MGEETAFRDFAARLAGVSPGDPSGPEADTARADREEAARELLARYAAALVALARKRIGPQLAGKVDPEDVLQSVLRTFFRRLDAGQVELRGWAPLWGFLALTTLRKVRRKAAAFGTDRRDAGREVRLRLPGPDESWDVAVPDRGPTPDEAAAFAEEVEALLTGLKSRDRRAVELIFAGASPAEAAAEIGCARRTVERTLVRLEERLLARSRAEAEKEDRR